MKFGIWPDNSDKSWERLGREDPYYGVLGHDRFRNASMTEARRHEFMESGEAMVAGIVATLEQHFGPLRSHHSALDFGCGVGRLLIPMARRFGHVTGVDISPGMVEEARRNAGRENLKNIDFVHTVDELTKSGVKFNLIISRIVLQHIPLDRGEAIISQLLGLLDTRGAGAIHVNLRMLRPSWRKLGAALRRRISVLNVPANLLNGRPWDEPMMQMNEYNLDRLFARLCDAGIDRVLVQRDGDDSTFQATLYFNR